MFKCIFIISFFCYFNMLAYDFNASKILNKVNVNKANPLIHKLEKQYPKLAKKLSKIKKSIESNIIKSGDVVFMFTSASVPMQSMEKFIIEGSILNYFYNTKVILVFQGITNKKFEEKLFKLRKNFGEFESASFFLTNLNRVIDPSIFKELNITQVPVIAYAKHKGDFYPSNSTIIYLSRGDNSLRMLFERIIQKDESYENYYNSIANTK